METEGLLIEIDEERNVIYLSRGCGCGSVRWIEIPIHRLECICDWDALQDEVIPEEVPE